LTAFAEAEKRADIILITGGLGPTSDASWWWMKKPWRR
jgi:molybdopterin-biosynthesis enzyme MoeA-like protein